MRGTTIISGSSIVIGGKSNAENDTKVLVKVPRGTALNLSGIEGNTVIGDTEGDVTATVSTSGNIEAGRIKNLNASIQGHGSITVAEVCGSVIAQIMGHGNVTVRKGSIEFVTANVMGHGNVNIKGRAENATLTVMGHGSINIAHVENEPQKSLMGHGSINIGNR
jgi:hypothetical protein